MKPIPASTPLLADVRHLIDAARQRVASAVNAELTQLYWQIGRRISTELLQGQRAEYGKQAVAERGNSRPNSARGGASNNCVTACVWPRFSRMVKFSPQCGENCPGHILRH